MHAQWDRLQFLARRNLRWLARSSAALAAARDASASTAAAQAAHAAHEAFAGGVPPEAFEAAKADGAKPQAPAGRGGRGGTAKTEPAAARVYDRVYRLPNWPGAEALAGRLLAEAAAGTRAELLADKEEEDRGYALAKDVAKSRDCLLGALCIATRHREVGACVRA